MSKWLYGVLLGVVAVLLWKRYLAPNAEQIARTNAGVRVGR